MSDLRKTKAQLVEELGALRARVKELDHARAQHRRVEKDLRESEEKWRSLTEHSPNYVMTVDLDGTILFINRTAPGVPKEKVIGSSLYGWVGAEDGARINACFGRVLRTGQPDQYECTYHGDGEIVLHIEAGVGPLKRNGRTVAFTVIGLDITERKRAEEALRKSEARQALILRSLPMALYAADASGDFGATWVSEQIEQISGFPSRRWVEEAEFWTSRLHPDDRERVLKEYGALLIENAIAIEYRWRCADGCYHWFLDQAALVRDEHGNPKEAIGTWLDITERKQNEGNLRLQARILENMAEGVNLVRVGDRRIVYANPTFERMFGYDSGELIGENISIVNAPGEISPQEAADDIVRVLEQGGIWSGEIQNIKKDGTTFWCHANVSTFGHPEYGPVWATVQQDISERKQAEKALQESEDRLRTITQNAPDFIVQVDRAGTIIFMNRTATGISPEEVVGSCCLDWIPPENRGAMEEVLRRVFEDAGPQVYETVAPGANREHRWYACHVAPISVGDEVASAIISAVDITERKRAEEALRESEERYRGLFEQAADSIVVVDTKTGAFTEFNDKAHENLGYTRREFQNLRIADLEAVKSPGEVADHIAQILRDGSGTFETRHRTKDGQIRDVRVNCKVLRIGGRQYYQSIWCDITERKRAEEDRARLQDQLRQAQKMEAVGTLASGIAHDFSNLLTAIFGYTDLAKMVLPVDHPARQSLEMVEQSAKQARGITNALLTFSHKKVAEKEPVSLAKIVRLTTGLLRRVLPASVEITEDLPEECEIWVSADATQIQQILMNLAVNARDAMPQGGRLRIALRREPPEPGRTGLPDTPPGRAHAVLVVEDNGVGMSKHVKSRIFEPFFTTKPRGRGTGLGLSVIHGIVRDHAGRIEIDSEPQGGTRATVFLPCCTPGDVAAARRAEASRTAGHGELVVVVEDDDQVRSIMTSTLRARGYEVLPVALGAEALSELDARGQAVRLVVLDLDLPDKNGVVLLREIRRRRTDLPFVVVTGSVDHDPTAYLSANDSLLLKPFQMLRLVATVARSLGVSAPGGS